MLILSWLGIMVCVDVVIGSKVDRVSVSRLCLNEMW